MTHPELTIIDILSKNPLEIALERFGISLSNGYLKHQIDAICDKNQIINEKSYLSVAKGTYSQEDTFLRIENSKTNLSLLIKKHMQDILEENEFIIID